ncbi:uncharacterized protein V1518DRAFT_414726 [Limtongia smithiae]|uniref:uncharacterized protein n=1 Tax=Limtongia smithiae TaxID=1125753 RepID=UPI0034CEC5C7
MMTQDMPSHVSALAMPDTPLSVLAAFLSSEEAYNGSIPSSDHPGGADSRPRSAESYMQEIDPLILSADSMHIDLDVADVAPDVDLEAMVGDWLLGAPNATMPSVHSPSDAHGSPASASSSDAPSISAVSSDSSLSRAGTIQQKRRRGRPRLNDQHSQAERRRAQIRDAQRTYRQKKDRTITDLRSRVSLLEATVESLQSVFLGVYDQGVEVAMSNRDATFVHTLASAAENVLKLTRSAIPDTSSDAVVTAVKTNSEESSELSPTSGALAKLSFTHAVPEISFAAIDVLKVPVSARPGNTRYEQFIESVYRMSLHFAKMVLTSGNDDAINRYFPDGVDAQDVLPGLNALLMSKKPIDGRTTRAGELQLEFPGLLSPRGVAEAVQDAEMRSIAAGTPMIVDLDAMTTFLFGRAVCKRRVPRYKIEEVDIGIILSQRKDSFASSWV